MSGVKSYYGTKPVIGPHYNSKDFFGTTA